VAFAQDRDLLVLEDDPYSTLRFEGDPLPSLRSLDATGRVIYLGTLSKIFSPGIRIGWVHAPHPILHRVNLSKQGADLCSSPLPSSWRSASSSTSASRGRGGMNRLYAARRDAMVGALAEALPTPRTPSRTAACSCGRRSRTTSTRPTCWPPRSSTTWRSSPARRVPGRRQRARSLRLNFSAMDEDRIVEGIRGSAGSSASAPPWPTR
jgi:2-aminoadipate transaminase